MIAALALLLGQAAPPPPDCRFDRAAALALDFAAFDQSVTSGWRPIAKRRCTVEAADLIRDYRAAHPDSDRLQLLFWHEGQLRATAGQTAAAIEAFRQAYKPPEMDAGLGWNLYVEGTIAFLAHDRAALQRARDTLAALPKPENWGRTIGGTDGKARVPSWPLNLGVLDGFLRCFDKPFAEAYQKACRV